MGDVFKNIYNCGGFAPYEYKMPENWGGEVFSFEDDFPTADEMRDRKQKLSTIDMAILDEIKKLLDSANDCTSITYEGSLSSTVKKFLYERGYKITAGRQYNTDYTTISWSK